MSYSFGDAVMTPDDKRGTVIQTYPRESLDIKVSNGRVVQRITAVPVLMSDGEVRFYLGTSLTPSDTP